ncbi:2-C-methyl-D-erythritol 4-phosphate cytidylyltransferase [Syntrophomonas wolfei]|jgi:2-C-methyl-D-erythritol 4-phosphate cytidylyltransferase|nr:2-C-methyl-D-erythritol 4-phosphate cytidylyltransferase [Syntrophomonas wolfei]
MVNNLRVVIAAAGSGSRMGGKINKQYILLKSRPLLAYSLDVFEKMELVDEIVIVAQAREIEYCEREVVKRFSYQKVSRVVAGGLERQDSIWAGLEELNSNTDFVAVHDGARPFVTSELIEEVLKEAVRWGAAIPGVAVRDTLKQVDRDNFVRQTLDRSSVFAIQTPQIFRYCELHKAYEYAREQRVRATDDASLFEKYIGRVKVVPGDYRNLKITTPEDLAIARTILDSLGKE